MIRLLLTKRWLGYLGLVVVFALACSAFGIWQWNRRAEALAAIDRLESNYDAQAIPLDEVLQEPGDFELSQQWTPVEMTGSYLAEDQLLLRGRTRDGELGFDFIVPFLTTDGTVFLVDRGWVVADDENAEPVTDVQPPSGELTVIARLRPNEGEIVGRGAPEGQIASVDLPVLAKSFDLPVYTAAYGLLASEDGVEAAGLAAATKPILDEGPHLSYCLQWFAFALMGFFGFGWALRNEHRLLTEHPEELEERERAKRERKGPSDADIEDAILDG